MRIWVETWLLLLCFMKIWLNMLIFRAPLFKPIFNIIKAMKYYLCCAKTHCHVIEYVCMLKFIEVIMLNMMFWLSCGVLWILGEMIKLHESCCLMIWSTWLNWWSCYCDEMNMILVLLLLTCFECGIKLMKIGFWNDKIWMIKVHVN